MVLGGSWLLLEVLDESWWFLVVLVVLGDSWCFLVVLGGYR